MDSSLFILIGKGITKGYIPYVNLFDHKGPILFFIEALGWWINPNRLGIFFIQWIFMVANLTLTFKIGQLFLNKKWSWVPILFFLLILTVAFEGGNLTEEYSLPFLFLPLYLALKYFKTESREIQHPPLYALVYGLCFTLIIFIRLNNAVLIGAIILVVMIHLIRNKAYRNFFNNVLTFLSGSIFIFSAIGIYFLVNNAFGEMLYATFLFNLKYAEGSKGISTGSDLMYFFYYVSPAIFSGGMGLYYFLRKEKKSIGLLLMVASAVTFLSLSMGGNFFHYFVLTTPCLVLGIVLFIEIYVEKRKKLWQKEYRLITIGVLILFLATNSIYFSLSYFATQDNVDLLVKQPQKEYYDTALSMANLIPLGDRNSVLGYSVPAGWFLITDIMPCYKYFTLQEWWGLYDLNVITRTNEFLENDSPKWIVMANNKQTNEKIYDILAAKYELIKQDKVVTLYRRIT
ncbi:MAG: hypothetical protein JJE18_07610 [Eubacteriaceae bacterium]|nr:hypothetical protein [Eubacteriaceae bacterium]